jgi:hypothetical protein
MYKDIFIPFLTDKLLLETSKYVEKAEKEYKRIKVVSCNNFQATDL